MKRGQPFVVAALVALMLLCALLTARVVERAGLLRLELGRARIATVSRATRQRLAQLERPVSATWYRTPPDEMPAQLAGLEESVRATFEAFAAASDGRFQWRILDPAAHPDWSEVLASSGVAPWRARRVERDGWREERVWSSLVLTCGPRPAAVINGLGPEQVPELQRLILAEVDQLLRPRRPRIALDAPAGFERLRAELGRDADVAALDFEAGAPLPDDVDLFVWAAPRACGADELARLDRFLARGGSALVAGGAAEETAVSGDPQRVRFSPTGFPSATFLAHYGLRALDGLLLDARASSAATSATARAAPHELACIAPEQDFRALRGQPNGTLLFRTPSAFEPEPGRLAELGLQAKVLGSLRAGAVLAPLPSGGLARDALAGLGGQPAPKAALAALLTRDDPWSGELVVLAAASPLEDATFDDERYAHRRLVRVALGSLLTTERLVARRIALARPAAAPELGARDRLLWRLFVVAAAPALVLLLASRRLLLLRLASLRAGALASRVRGLGRILAPPLALALVVLALAGLPSGGRALDLSANGAQGLRATELETLHALVAARQDEAPFVLESWFSAPDRLPPELRPLARDARALCDVLASRLENVQHRAQDVAELDEARLGQLARLGLAPHAVSSSADEVTTVRRVVSALRWTHGGEARVVELSRARDFETLPFRLAFALWRLATGRELELALAADPPRLTPAQAALEYQRQGLFPPREGDVYSELRALLARAGFRVRAIDSTSAEPLTADLLLWVQPRRDVTPTMARAAQLLAGGGRVVIAAQHYRVLARQLQREGLQLAFWPEPQFNDVDRHYLPQLGIELAREVLFDAVSAPLEIETRVDRPDGGAEYVRQQSAQAFLIRAPEAQFARDVPALRGLGELLLPCANRIRWDVAQLARRGLAAEPWIFGSARAWAFDWQGGDLPAEVLAEPVLPQELDGPQPLVVRFRGHFPDARRVVDGTREGAGRVALELVEPPTGAPAGDLLLVGCSDMWRNELLFEPRFQNDRLALAAAAELLLPPELASFLHRRAAAPGLGYVSPAARLRWRALVLAGLPLLVLLVAALRRWRA